jgi:hypothetical protein
VLNFTVRMPDGELRHYAGKLTEAGRELSINVLAVRPEDVPPIR